MDLQRLPSPHEENIPCEFHFMFCTAPAKFSIQVSFDKHFVCVHIDLEFFRDKSNKMDLNYMPLCPCVCLPVTDKTVASELRCQDKLKNTQSTRAVQK